MEPDTNINQTEVALTKHPVFCITPVSKYLAMILFVILPFLGGYVGYVNAPERVVEKVVTKEVLVESESVVQTGVVISQLMWFWRVIVDSSNNVAVVEPEALGADTKVEISAPEGWLISQSESEGVSSIKSIMFTDPDYPGKEDTDTPKAYLSLTFGQKNETCNDAGDTKINDNLSNIAVTVYDSGWEEGWADLPSRVICIDTDQEYGEVIEMSLYPITDDNKDMMDRLVEDIVVN
jgi:hypothetical protein